MSLSSQRSVLLFAFHFPPESLAGANRPARFFRYLPKFGYVPEVITGAVQPEGGVPHVHYIPAPTYIPNKYTLAGATEIILHKAGLPTELALLWAGPASRCGARLISNSSPAAIISTAPPTNTHLAALRLKRQTGLPWIADFRDPIVGNPFRNYGKIPALADKAIEKLIFRHADLVIAVTEVMADDWKARYPQWEYKIRVLWNGYDPAEAIAPAAHTSPENSRVMAHLGSLYGDRYPGRLLISLKRLLERGQIDTGRFRLKFIGDVCQDVPDSCAAAMADLRSRNIIEFLGRMSRQDALKQMVGADCLLLLDITGQERGYAVPSKLYEYIRAGRPILAFTQRDSQVARILEKSGIRHRCVLTQDSDDETDSKVAALLNEPSEPLPPSDWFLNTFDGHLQTATLAAMIDSLGKAR